MNGRCRWIWASLLSVAVLVSAGVGCDATPISLPGPGAPEYSSPTSDRWVDTPSATNNPSTGSPSYPGSVDAGVGGDAGPEPDLSLPGGADGGADAGVDAVSADLGPEDGDAGCDDAGDEIIAPQQGAVQVEVSESAHSDSAQPE